MATFIYKAKDYQGKVREGEIKSRNRSMASSRLKNMRFKIVSLSMKIEPGTEFLYEEKIIGSYVYKDVDGNIQINLSSDKPTAKDIIIFTKQLATMLASGVELIKSIEVILKQQKSKELRIALFKCLKKIEAGSSLSEAFREQGHIFDSLYIAMLSAGEQSGKLDVILLKLVSYIERSEKVKSQVKSAMYYPAGVLAISLVVVSGLLVYVVPTFAEQFKDSGKELPVLTQFILDLSNYFTLYWLHFVTVFIAAFLYFRTWNKSDKGKQKFDSILLQLPYFGPMLKKVSIGRFCSTLSSMLSSGVNLLGALTICASSAGNKVIEKFILDIRSSLEKGEKFSVALAAGDLIPDMVVSMVAVGESTGALDDMLVKVSKYYEEEVDEAIKSILALIEPALIIFLGVVIGTVVVAMYLPIFDMAGSIS